MNEPLEIEKKFLIRRPEAALLDSLASEKWELRQSYLLGRPEQGSRRVRRCLCNGETRFYYSEKIRLTDMTRIEREREVSAAEAETLLKEADPERRPIEKTRWRIPYAGQTLEIDAFAFWPHQAFCEVELKCEEQRVVLPEWVELLRDVTGDGRYTNNNLARTVPEEESYA